MCGATVPLFSSPILSKQPGREASVEAVVEGKSVRFIVHNTDRRLVARSRCRAAAPASNAWRAAIPWARRNLDKLAGKAAYGLQLMAVCVDLPKWRRPHIPVA